MGYSRVWVNTSMGYFRGDCIAELFKTQFFQFYLRSDEIPADHDPPSTTAA